MHGNVDDVRHDVYLTLDHGVFNKGTKRADKNVEVDMEIIDEKEQIIAVRLSCLCLCNKFPISSI